MSGKKYVCNGAILQCDQGIKPAKLLVTENTKLKVQGKLLATHLDLQVPDTFVKCKLKPVKGDYLPCVTALQPWTKTSPDATLGKNKKLLLEESECNCATGGKITIMDTTQINSAGSVIMEYLEIARAMPGAMLDNEQG